MSATDWKVISKNDLAGPIPSGEFVRAYCRCHHDKRPRSLEINPHNGFGRCFRCDDQILVREWNHQAAEMIERAQKDGANGTIKVRDPKYIKTKYPLKPVVLAKWQQDELAMLRQVQVGMERLLQKDERAQAYIAARGLSLESAKVHHVGYIPASLPPKYKAIEKWRDHIIFPVYHPTYGVQFAGRNLHLWQPGMDENEHKELLAPLEEQGILRWRKTHTGGWFNMAALEEARSAVFVEGAFDALALIEAGLANTIAVIGTAIKAEWVPAQMSKITLAFDGDAPGLEKARKARDLLYIKGYEVEMSSPPTDNMGTDWSERYRLHGVTGLAPLLGCVIATCTQPVVYRGAAGDWWCAEHRCIADYGSSNEPETCSQCESSEIVDVDDEGRPYCALHLSVLEAV